MAPIKRINLYSAVNGEIRRMIQDGELKAGDQLPDHTDFTGQLQSNRTTPRGEMYARSLLGAIEQRSDYGTVLPPQCEKNFRFPPLEGTEAKALLEARKVTELGIRVPSQEDEG